jgi:phosphodiesterase/alkaline phosphatase D-like protein
MAPAGAGIGRISCLDAPFHNPVRGNILIRLLFTICVTASVAGLLSPNRSSAQDVSPGRAPRVKITDGPAVESVRYNSAIIRWTSGNPGGTDEHFGVVSYGTNPAHLTQLAKSHIRLNRNHPTTIFRVLVDGLTPQTTYYYKVDSTTATGTSDGVVSPVKHFTTARNSQRSE